MISPLFTMNNNNINNENDYNTENKDGIDDIDNNNNNNNKRSIMIKIQDLSNKISNDSNLFTNCFHFTNQEKDYLKNNILNTTNQLMHYINLISNNNNNNNNDINNFNYSDSDTNTDEEYDDDDEESDGDYNE